MSTAQWRKNNADKVAGYKRKHYLANTKKVIGEVKARRLKTVAFMASLKQTLMCMGCGESHISCLDFHHRNPNKKDIEISRAIRRGWGERRLLEEIAKCDVLCSNCHRILHYEERNSAGLVEWSNTPVFQTGQPSVRT